MLKMLDKSIFAHLLFDRMRSRAKHDLSGSFVPSRQVIVRHAPVGRLNARSLTLTG